MSIFRRRQPVPAQEQRDFFTAGGSYGWFGGASFTHAGVSVDSEQAMTHAAVWAAIRLIAGTASMLPVDQIRYSGDTRRPMTPASIVTNPSGSVRRSGWVYQILESMLRHGNAYAMVTRFTGQGFPAQLDTLPHAAVRWQPYEGATVPFVNNNPVGIYPNGQLLHIPAILEAGCPVGISPLDYGRQDIGTGLAAAKFGAQFFASGGHPTQIVQPKTDPGPEGVNRIKAMFKMASENRDVVVMGDADVKQMQVAPSDSQFLDLMRFICEQVARWFYVPPEMIFAAVSGQAVTYANVDQRDLSFLKYSLQFWLSKVEEAWSECLPAPQVVRFNVDAFLRSDAMTRMQVHDIAIRNGIETVDEARAMEDRPPLPQGANGSPQRIADVASKMWRGVDLIYTDDEAREVMNMAGANLPIPGPDDLGVKPATAPDGTAPAGQPPADGSDPAADTPAP